MNKIKFTLIFISILLFASCISESRKPLTLYNWETEIEVKYIDNEIDTILHSIKLYSGLEPKYELMSVEHGVFTSHTLVPCLVYKHFSVKNLACSVKRFRILNQSKTIQKTYKDSINGK